MAKTKISKKPETEKKLEPIEKVKKLEKKDGRKKIGKFSGISEPLPAFPSDLDFLSKFCLETAKRLDEEMKDVSDHIKEKYTKDILTHLYNTNRTVDRLLYVVLQMMHYDYHVELNFNDMEKMKKTLATFDKKF